MQEDEEDREARLKQEADEKALHKLTKLAHALKMDVKALQAMEVAAKASRKVLRLGTKTKEIVWRRRGIMQPEIEHLTNVLSFQELIGREVVTTLDLKTNLVGRGGAQLLANCFAKSKQLTKLDLSENNIGDAGCESLAQGLLHPQGCLVHLDLGGNKISVAGVASIASRLPEAAHLTVLGLSFNSLCHSGLRPLAEVKLGNLRSLDLRGNQIDDRAARVLAEGVVGSETIAFIDVRENINSREATALFGRAIRDRTRRYKNRIRTERRKAKKEKRKYTEPTEKLPELEFYWIEPHQLRDPPGNSAVVNGLARACVVS